MRICLCVCMWVEPTVQLPGDQNAKKTPLRELQEAGSFSVFRRYGSRGRIRTYDPLISSRLSYDLCHDASFPLDRLERLESDGTPQSVQSDFCKDF